MKTSERSQQHLTARVSFAERPEVVDQLRDQAFERGHSVSDEIRAAVRSYIRTKEAMR